jgi:YD repeat-containing protein
VTETSTQTDPDEYRAFQFLIWGYAVEGDVTENDALLAEGAPSHRTRWDYDRRGLSSARIDRGNGWEPVPDWWALQYLPMEWREEQYSRDE